MCPLRVGSPAALDRASSNLVGGRIRDLKGLHSGSTFNHLGQGLQYLGISFPVVSVRAVFLIPETNSHCLIPFRGDKANLISKSPLLAEKGNYVVLKSACKFGRARP